MAVLFVFKDWIQEIASYICKYVVIMDDFMHNLLTIAP